MPHATNTAIDGKTVLPKAKPFDGIGIPLIFGSGGFRDVYAQYLTVSYSKRGCIAHMQH